MKFQVKRIKDLQKHNAKLKKLVAQQKGRIDNLEKALKEAKAASKKVARKAGKKRAQEAQGAPTAREESTTSVDPSEGQHDPVTPAAV